MRLPRVVAIIPAAGHGKRLGAKVKKPFILLDGKPLISYALTTLNSCKCINGIIIASERSYVKRFKEIAKRFEISKLIDVVVGGKTRFESVRNCIKRVDPSFDIVIIHDAARPLIDKRTVEKSIKAAQIFGSCVVAIPESDTVKLVDKDFFIKGTLDRNKIFRAQTPQTFKLNIIKKAYSANAVWVTDDASLVEAMGSRVKIVEGSYRNLKITTKEDLKSAEALLCESA